MNVEFLAKPKRTCVITHGARTTVIKQGKYRTQDKKEIEYLMGSPEYRQNIISLKTEPELVEKYLSGEEPDKLTEEVLLNVTDEGLVKLANYLQLRDHGNYPTMIRVMAKGAYVDNKMSKILKEHSREKPATDLKDEAEKVGVIFKDGVWYKFISPESGDAENLGRDENKVAKFIQENKQLVEKAISLENEPKEENDA